MISSCSGSGSVFRLSPALSSIRFSEFVAGVSAGEVSSLGEIVLFISFGVVFWGLSGVLLVSFFTSSSKSSSSSGIFRDPVSFFRKLDIPILFKSYAIAGRLIHKIEYPERSQVRLGEVEGLLLYLICVIDFIRSRFFINMDISTAEDSIIRASGKTK